MSGDWPTLRSALIIAIRANQPKYDTLAHQVGGTLRSDARVAAARRAAVQRVERASGYQDYVRGASPVPKAKTIRRFQRSHDRHGVRCRWAIDDLATLNPKLSTTWVNINAESYKKINGATTVGQSREETRRISLRRENGQWTGCGFAKVTKAYTTERFVGTNKGQTAIPPTFARPEIRANDYGICRPEMARAITRRWISEVPSKIV